MPPLSQEVLLFLSYFKHHCPQILYEVIWPTLKLMYLIQVKYQRQEIVCRAWKGNKKVDSWTLTKWKFKECSGGEERRGRGERGKGRNKGKNEEKKREKTNIFLTHKLNIRSHGKQHVWCEAWWMNIMFGQWCTSPDAGQLNPTGQPPESNSSVRKLLLLIFKSGI